MKGFIYILSNPSFERDVYKIGMTTRKDISHRIKELFNTSLPFPFKCEYLGSVNNITDTEVLIHSFFDYYRLNPNREFFKVKLSEAIKHIEILIQKDYTELLSHDSCPWIYVASEENFRKLVKKRGAYLTSNDVLNLKQNTRIYHRIHGEGIFLSASKYAEGMGYHLRGTCYFHSIVDTLTGIDVSGGSIITF